MRANPSASVLDPEKCYLGWEIRLVTDKSEQQVREAFLFVEDGGQLSITAFDYVPAESLNNQTTFQKESLRDFFSETHEHLASMEDALLALESSRESRDLVNTLFRALHNLKGNAGVLLSERGSAIPPQHPLYYIQRVGHAAENLFEESCVD